jgi:hypothetical protein
MYKTHMRETHSPRDFFKLRLKIARLRRGFATTEDAAEYFDALPEPRRITARTYRGWEGGERIPSTPGLYDVLEQELQVNPRGWLKNGAGEGYATLQEEFARLDAARREEARKARKGLADTGQSGKGSALVYQLTPNPRDFDISSSQSVPLRRIPVLSGDDIAAFLAGEREAFMAGHTVVIPPEAGSPDAWSYVIPDRDEAMVGTGGISFPPGTGLVFDPREDVPPGKFMIARPKGLKIWLFRRFVAGLPLSAVSEFKLEALNPSVEPIRVSDREKWEFGGRLILTFHRW